MRLLPGLQGWVARVGANAWTVQEIENTVLPVCGAAAGGASRPRLVCWVRGVAAGEMIRLRSSYPDLEVMLDVQDDGLWIKPIVDPVISEYASALAAGKWNDSASAAPGRVTVIGGPGIACAHLGWGDPRWMWQVATQVRQYGLDGMYLCVTQGDWSVLEESFGVYAVNSGTDYNRGRWVKRLEEIFDLGVYAGQLLEAMEHASAIMPTLEQLVCGPPDRFAPQYGLLLVHYLELPTYSDYLNQQRVLQEGRPWVWPRLLWDEPVAGIQEYVDREARRIAIRPDTLTNDIGRHVDAIRGLLRNLRANPPGDVQKAAPLGRILDQIELTAQLGRHYHHKLRAAIGWQRFKSGRENHLNCIRGLRESVEAWRDVVRVADRLQPGNVTFWQSQPVDVPPWTSGQIDRSFRLIEGHWRDQMRRFERELDLVQETVSLGRETATLPLWDQVNARPISELQVSQQIGFELPGDDRFHLTDFGELTGDPKIVMSEKKSLLADALEAAGEGWHVAMMTDPGHCTLLAHRRYQIGFSYRVLATPETHEPAFMVGVRPAAGRGENPPVLDPAGVRGDHPAWFAPAGYLGSRIIQIPPLPGENEQFFLAVRSGAAIAIDQLSIDVVPDYREVPVP